MNSTKNWLIESRRWYYHRLLQIREQILSLRHQNGRINVASGNHGLPQNSRADHLFKPMKQGDMKNYPVMIRGRYSHQSRITKWNIDTSTGTSI